ncbi:MAG: TetR/AcrR family transcriptional regulator [Pseudomonadota bacterium]
MNQEALLTRGERTRAHIVACAASLFWARSFHGVSVDQVAEAAGVNKATVYRYFADKRDLALAVVRYNGMVTRDVIFATSFAEFSEPQDRLAAIYRQAYCNHSQIHAEEGDVYGCPIVGLSLELGQEMPEVREEAKRLFDEVEGYFTAIAEQAAAITGASTDPAVTGRTLIQLMHGANASSRLATDPERVLDAGRASLALIGFPNTPILREDQQS